MERFLSLFNIIDSLKGYKKRDFGQDLYAGIIVSIILVPQGMAYAYLAGMPPIYGLYTGLIPLFVYSIFGTSRQLSIGPVAISAILVLEGVSKLAEPSTPEYIELVILAGLLIGLAQILFGLLRLGFFVNFISHPVIAGFTSAAALIIGANQLKDVFGIAIPRFSHFTETVAYLFQHIDKTHFLPLLLSVCSIVLILVLKKISSAIPGTLIVVVLGTLATWYFSLSESGLAIIEEVPSGLPSFSFVNLDFATIKQLLPTVFTVTIIGIVESLGIGKALEARHTEYVLVPNRELFALGISKVLGSFFQAIPSSGSFTRSAINDEAGAKTGISSMVTSVIILFVLLFFTHLFYFLPKAVLAAIILLAVKGLFEWKIALDLWKNHRLDFYMMLTTFIGTLLLGIELGVMLGVALSIFVVLYKSTSPNYEILGRIPETTYFRSIDRFENAIVVDNQLIMRFDDQLYFGNSNFFKEIVRKLVRRSGPELKHFLLDAKSLHNLDSSGLHALEDIHFFLKSKGIEFYICGTIGPVRTILEETGYYERTGEEHHFLYLNEAVETINNKKRNHHG